MDWLAQVFSGPGAQMGLVAFTLALAFAAPPVGRAIKDWRGRRNGNGHHEEAQLLTRKEGEELQHRVANAAQVAVSKADVALVRSEAIERRVDRHSRILTEVQKELAETRGDLCARLENVENAQRDSGRLLRAVARKLEVDEA